jgi:predicted transcriptional regulator of viral defense system
MKRYLETFHQLKLFKKKDVLSLTQDDNATKELLRRYKKLGLISRIRRDLYTANELASKTGLATKYEIASQVTPTACLAYHSALEYHGLANQVFYEIYVSSEERFKNFEYEGIRYSYCESKISNGVITPLMDSLVKVTDLERTVIDCIDCIGRSGGLEELIMSFSLISYLKEAQLLIYLNDYKKQALYQKAGFILSYFQNEMKLSDDFFHACRSKVGNSIRYLTDTHESNTYFKKWQIYAPENILSYLAQGGSNFNE